MSVQVEEKTLELALVKAAGLLGVTQETLEHKVVSSNSGFLGLFGRKIVIEAWKKKKNGRQISRFPSQNSSSSMSSSPSQEVKKFSDKEWAAIKQDLQLFCKNICSHITNEEVKVSVSQDDDRLIFDINNDYLASQIAKNTKLAEAIEHLLRKKPRHLKQELPFRIFVDAKQARQNREDELIGMAQDLSDKVHTLKKPIVLNYKSPYDRKIIHMALDKDKRVYTKSIGNGPNRKLMILPSKEQRSEAHG